MSAESQTPRLPAFDEMSAQWLELADYVTASIRPHYQTVSQWLQDTDADTMRARREEAELLFRRVGITFAVYGDHDGGERTIPFDIVPRVFPAKEWATLRHGLIQRVRALNHFLHDVYHQQHILKAGIVPPEQVLKNAQYRPEMQDVDVPLDVYAHIAGIDIVRATHGEREGAFFVLEDNLRVPSGVSYMIENRKMMMRLFPALFAQHRIAPVEHYPDLLLDTLTQAASKKNVLLTLWS